MKKICAVWFAVFFILGNLSAMASGNDGVPKNYNETARLLSALDIVLGYDSSNASEEVTRGEFVTMVIAAAGLKGTMLSGDVFDDVIPGSTYYSVVYTAYKNGIISKDADKFMPDEAITMEQALAMLVRALGYGYYAQQKGGYPIGYLSTASSIGLTSGVSVQMQKKLCRSDAAVLLYNALHTDIMQQTSFGDKPVLSVEKNVSLMNVRLKIKSEWGVVTGNRFTKLTSPESGIPEDEVEIDGIRYKIGKTDAAQYLGYRVRYYYNDDETQSEKQLVYITPEDRNDILEIESDHIISFADGVLRYETEDGSKEESASIPNSADFIYNGKAQNAYSIDNITGIYGGLKLVDNNKDGYYDVVFAVNYTNYVVNMVDVKDSLITDKYNAGELVLDKTDSNNIIVITKNGSPVEISDLKEWDVLSVTKSINTQGKKYINVNVINDSFNGSVSEVYDDKVVINGSEFKLKYDGPEKLDSGVYGTFYLDIMGRICAFDSKTSSYSKYGYLIKAARTVGVSEGGQFKLFSQDGKIVTLNGAQTMFVDGDVVGSPAEAADSLGAQGPQLIRYKQNSNGDIYYIDTITVGKNETEDNLKKTASVSSAKFKSSSSIFGGQCAVKPSTIIFSIPADLTDERAFEIKKPNIFVNDNPYTFDGYDGDEVNVLKAVVINAANALGIDNNTPLALVDKVTQGLDRDGEVKYKLNVLQNGQYTSVLVSDNSLIDGKNIQQGDIIRYSVDGNGEVDSITKAFNADGSAGYGSEISISAPAYGTVDSDYRVAYGVVDTRKDTYMTVKIGTETELFELSRAKVYIYNRALKSVEVGRYSDIMDSSGTASKIVLHSRYGDLREVIILK